MNAKRTSRHEREKMQKIGLLKEYMSNIFDLKDEYTKDYLKEIKELNNDRNRILISQRNEHQFILRILSNQSSEFKNQEETNNKTNDLNVTNNSFQE